MRHPLDIQRIQVLRARVPELSGRQRGVQCVRFHALAYRPQDDRLDRGPSSSRTRASASVSAVPERYRICFQRYGQSDHP